MVGAFSFQALQIPSLRVVQSEGAHCPERCFCGVIACCALSIGFGSTAAKQVCNSAQSAPLQQSWDGIELRKLARGMAPVTPKICTETEGGESRSEKALATQPWRITDGGGGKAPAQNWPTRPGSVNCKA